MNMHPLYSELWWYERIDDERQDLLAHLAESKTMEDMVPWHDSQLAKCGHFLRHASDVLAGRAMPSDWPEWL